MTYAFECQDKPILEAQQLAIGDAELMDLHPVLLSADAGAARARKVLEKLILAAAQVEKPITATEIA